MSEYYNPKKTYGLFEDNPAKPFRLSRSKIDLFLECPRCFYLDRKIGVSRPPGYPFNLNSAVDSLLKKEFDIHRLAATVHPLVKSFGLDLIPLAHAKIDEWRDSLRRGVSYALLETNLIITGGIDDVWVDPATEELVIVDYKATSKNGQVSIDAPWQISYKRQMEVYQWLFRRNGFAVSDTGYFVYCNGKTDGPAFDAKLEFDISLIPYTGRDDWVEKTIRAAYRCLQAGQIPAADSLCDYCRYIAAVNATGPGQTTAASVPAAEPVQQNLL